MPISGNISAILTRLSGCDRKASMAFSIAETSSEMTDRSSDWSIIDYTGRVIAPQIAAFKRKLPK